MATELTMKTFSLHWRGGVIEEEAQIHRMPLTVDERDLGPRRRALRRTPRLRRRRGQVLA